jgi:hypothetical protein
VLTALFLLLALGVVTLGLRLSLQVLRVGGVPQSELDIHNGTLPVALTPASSLVRSFTAAFGTSVTLAAA